MLTNLFDHASDEQLDIMPDWLMLTDATPIEVIQNLESISPKFQEKVVVFIDHDTPCGSSEAAVLQKKLIEFAGKNGAKLYNGRGIGYQLMIDNHIKKGDVIACCGKHSTVFSAADALGVSLSPAQMISSLEGAPVRLRKTGNVEIELKGKLCGAVTSKDVALILLGKHFKTMEGNTVVFTGEGAEMLLYERIAICAMLGEADVKAVTFDSRPISPSISLDLNKITPVVSGPNGLSCCMPADAVNNITVNEVFVGGCTSGRMENLRILANALGDKKIPSRVRLIVAPATCAVFNQAANEGLITRFLDAGALVMNQGCSVCWGRSQGYVDKEETMVSSGAYCYPACAGDKEAKVYLASACTAAACALNGVICRPEEEAWI